MRATREIKDLKSVEYLFNKACLGINKKNRDTSSYKEIKYKFKLSQWLFMTTFSLVLIFQAVFLPIFNWIWFRRERILHNVH